MQFIPKMDKMEVLERGEGPNRKGGLPLTALFSPKYFFPSWSPKSGYQNSALRGDLLKSLI